MADIFGRQDQVLLGGLSSDSLFMTWPDLVAGGVVGLGFVNGGTGITAGGGLGMLIQQISMDYSQNIRRIFEIGPGIVPIGGGGFANGALCDGPTPPPACNNRSQPTYYIISRPEGNMQARKFVGPQALGQCFYRQYGSPCGPNVITLSGKAGCSAGDQNSKLMTWNITGVTVNRHNMDVNGQEMVIQDGFSAMFAGLQIKINNQDPICSITDAALAAAGGGFSDAPIPG